MTLHDASGAIVRLESVPLGNPGGEGAVYAVVGRPTVAAKILHLNRRTSERRLKLEAMLARPPADPMATAGSISIAWPQELLFGDGGIAGFTMPKLDVSQYTTLYEVACVGERLQRPGFARWNWDYLLNVAANLASLTEAVHQVGHVIGDFNPRNFLVSPNTLVAAIDCDSMQIRGSDGYRHGCAVVTPDCIPPELRLPGAVRGPRGPDQDVYSLAVITWMLLSPGFRPDAGGDAANPTANLEAGTFYAADERHPAPNNAPPRDIVPAHLLGLFERTLGPGHRDRAARPSAREWKHALDGARAATRTCTAFAPADGPPAHVYSAHLARCPWCDYRARFRGALDPFDPDSNSNPRVLAAARAALRTGRVRASRSSAPAVGTQVPMAPLPPSQTTAPATASALPPPAAPPVRSISSASATPVSLVALHGVQPRELLPIVIVVGGALALASVLLVARSDDPARAGDGREATVRGEEPGRSAVFTERRTQEEAGDAPGPFGRREGPLGTEPGWAVEEETLFPGGRPAGPVVLELLGALAAPADEGGSPLTEADLRNLLRDPRARDVYQNELMRAATPVVSARPKPWALTKIFLGEANVAAGVAYLSDHRAALSRAAYLYQVEGKDVVSVLMWQSKLGEAAKVEYRLFNAFLSQSLFLDRAYERALATGAPAGVDLAAHRKKLDRTKANATKNLAALLRWCKAQGTDPLEVRGWWEGMVGFPQFMPESLRYAANGDKRRPIDLYSHDDAILSVASYLDAHGYRKAREHALYEYNPKKEWVSGVILYADAIDQRAAALPR